MLSHAKANGHILWAGFSLLDGAPIVAIAVGEESDSTNGKTGALVQTYILRADVAPIPAARSGADRSVCGDCPFTSPNAAEYDGRAVGTLSGRVCYVNLGQGPEMVYHSWQKGNYPFANDIARVGAGRLVRVGTYGDPAAVPSHVWSALLSRAAGWTGYTHQPDRAPDLRPYLMASARSVADAARLQANGWRTFAVIPDGAPIPSGSILCPSVSRGVQCADCLLCDGARPGRERVKSIAIPAHGSGAANLGTEVL